MKQIFNRISLIFGTLAFSSVVLTGCLADVDVTAPPSPGEKTGRVNVALQVPGMKTPSTRAMSAANEGHIETLDVLVFDNAYTPAQLVDHYPVDDFTVNGGGYNFSLGQLSKSSGLTLAVIANASAEVESALTAAKGSGSSWKGATKNAVLNALQYTFTERWPANLGGSSEPVIGTDVLPIPMYGEATYTNNIYDNSTKDITLTRMLARIDVINNVAPASLTARQEGDFLLTRIHIFARNVKGMIAPPYDNNGVPTSGSPKMPNLPDWLDAGIAIDGDTELDEVVCEYSVLSNTGRQYCQNTIYTFESWAAYGGEGEDWSGYGDTDIQYTATSLILEGEYTDGDGTTGTYFYPVHLSYERDSEDGTTSFMPILRNHKYVVSVTGAEAPGYVELADAIGAHTKLNNLKTRTVSYDEGAVGNMVFNGQYMLGIDEANPILTCESQILTLWAFMDNQLSYWYAWVEDEDTNDWLSVSKLRRDPYKGRLDITVDAFTPQSGETSRQATVMLSHDGLRLPVTVTQTSGSGYYIRLTDGNGDEIDALNFGYHVGESAVPSQRVYVQWNTGSGLVISETPDTQSPFDHAGASPADGGPVSGGVAWFDIQPEPGSAADLDFAKTSVLTFTSSDGNGTTVTKELVLGQFEPRWDLVAHGGNPSALEFVSIKGYNGIDVFDTTGSKDNWTLTSSDATWLTVGVNQSSSPGVGSRTGKGNITLYVKVTSNVNSDDARTGTITLSRPGMPSKQITVSQIGVFMPPEHTGWAGSNIYWDADYDNGPGKARGRLTFDDMCDGQSPHEQYQGLLFKWGSLVGIGLIAKYESTGTNKTSIYWPEEYAGDIDFTADPLLYSSFVGIARAESGNLARGHAYEQHDPEAALGDICKYITDKGWAPGADEVPRVKWRMPVSNEFGTATSTASYTVTPAWSQWKTLTFTNMDGTTEVPHGVRRTETTPPYGVSRGTPFFPAAGQPNAAGTVSSYNGIAGVYWSSSHRASSPYNMSFGSSSKKVTPDNYLNSGWEYARSVRCVREKMD